MQEAAEDSGDGDESEGGCMTVDMELLARGIEELEREGVEVDEHGGGRHEVGRQWYQGDSQVDNQ